jgi:hypothetical protein
MVSGSSEWEPNESTRSAKKRWNTGSEQPWTSTSREPTAIRTTSRSSVKWNRSARAAGGQGFFFLVFSVVVVLFEVGGEDDGLVVGVAFSSSSIGGAGGCLPVSGQDVDGRWKALSSGQAHSSSAPRTTTRPLISSGSPLLDMGSPPAALLQPPLSL